MAVTKVLFANIGWMTHYKGNNAQDKIVGGGSWSNDDKHESYNFLPIGGMCYGYVQPVRWGRINLGKIDENCDNDYVDDVLIVWLAKHPAAGGTYIVGWYKHATVFEEFQDTKHKIRQYYSYNCKAKEKDCTLLPLDQRTFQVPRAKTAGKGFLGQSNIWYADSTNADVVKFRGDVIKYVENYRKTGSHVTKKAVQVNAVARKAVEKAAVACVTEYYQSLGYTIVSREKENIGWDLDAEKNGVKLKLEVKGLAESQVSVRISENEHKHMMANKDSYRLCVVTNAIKKPLLVRFIWDSSLGVWVSDENPEIVLTIEMKPSFLATVE